MTIREVLVSKLGVKVPDSTVESVLIERELDGDVEFDVSKQKSVDLATADLLLFVITQPKSVRELDYLLTQQDADALLKLRKMLLAKWGEEDPDIEGSFQNLSDRW